MAKNSLEYLKVNTYFKNLDLNKKYLRQEFKFTLKRCRKYFFLVIGSCKKIFEIAEKSYNRNKNITNKKIKYKNP